MPWDWSCNIPGHCECWESNLDDLKQLKPQAISPELPADPSSLLSCQEVQRARRVVHKPLPIPESAISICQVGTTTPTPLSLLKPTESAGLQK